MSEIPSLTELYTVIILLVPGFIAFRIFSWKANYEFFFTDLQTTLFSLIFSVVIFLPFAAIWNFQSITDLETRILKGEILASYFALAIVVGYLSGEITYRKYRKNIATGSVWIRFANKNVGDWVLLYTTDGEIYKGWIKTISSHDRHKREIELEEPKILTDEIRWKTYGKSTLFLEHDIKRIVVLD